MHIIKRTFYSDCCIHLAAAGSVVAKSVTLSDMVKAAVLNEVEDMLIMETKLKIIEILQVARVL